MHSAHTHTHPNYLPCMTWQNEHLLSSPRHSWFSKLMKAKMSKWFVGIQISTFYKHSLFSWAVLCFPSQYKACYIVQDRLKHPDTIDFYGSRVIWAQWNIFPSWYSDVNGAQIDCKQGGKAAYVKLYKVVYETSRASKLEHPGSNPADAILFFCHYFPFNAVVYRMEVISLAEHILPKKGGGRGQCLLGELLCGFYKKTIYGSKCQGNVLKIVNFAEFI